MWLEKTFSHLIHRNQVDSHQIWELKHCPFSARSWCWNPNYDVRHAVEMTTCNKFRKCCLAATPIFVCLCRVDQSGGWLNKTYQVPDTINFVCRLCPFPHICVSCTFLLLRQECKKHDPGKTAQLERYGTAETPQEHCTVVPVPHVRLYTV